VLVEQVVGCMSAAGQQVTAVSIGTRVAALPNTADELMGQMSLEAGVIFAGQVIAVRRPVGTAGAAEGVVEVDFRVDEPARGVSTGQIHTLREWAGLWAGSSERYRVGQRLLLFLRDTRAGGLSSTVHGAEGAIPLSGGGVAPGPDDSAATPAEWMVDLRWVQAQVLRREMGAGLPGHGPVRGPVRGPGRGFHSERVDIGTGTAAGAKQAPELVRAFAGPWIADDPAPQPQMEPLSQVLTLCRSRIRIRDASR
jgi:hypothetical protein